MAARDLAAIQESGVIRVLVHGADADGVPRTGSPFDRETALVLLFARARGLTVRFVRVPRFADLFDALLDGRGDLIAAQVSRTPKRAQRVAFSSPIRTVRELVVVPSGRTDAPTSVADLAGQQLWVRASSSHMETLLSRIGAISSPPQLVLVPEETETLAVLSRVGAGEYRLAVVDSDAVSAYQAYRSDVKVAFELKRDVAIAWAVRPDADRLRGVIDEFVRRNVAVHEARTQTGGLAAIKARGLLRVVMPNAAGSYFFYQGLPVGEQFVMAQRLANRLGVRLEVVVPRRGQDVIPLLLKGHADLIAPVITVTPGRQAKMLYSDALLEVDEMLVQPSGQPLITAVAQLAGKAIHIRRTSSYWETLSRLQGSVPDLKVVPADEGFETEDLVDKVGRGEIPLTVADYDIVAAELPFRKDIAAPLALGTKRRRAYAMRKGSPALRAEVNAFVATERLRLAGKRPDGRRIAAPAPPEGDLTPYDALAKRYAQRYGLDWRLIAAQMKEESGFLADSASWVGAEGLMRVMPHVAQGLGLGRLNLRLPEDGIHAGTAHLARLRDRFDGVKGEHRLKMALAAYRAGFGHVADARRLATEMELDAARWDGHVAKAMSLLARMEFADGARYGYCRAPEIIAYVDRVWTDYIATRP